MVPCPNFDCLDATPSNCDRFPACEGCQKLFDCNLCSNQSTLVNGQSLPCDMIHLPERCRFCQQRRDPDFSPEETCAPCPVKRETRR